MDQQPTTQSYTNDDEISLVDLLAVLIRFRRLIIGGTLAVTVIAAAALYGLPAMGIWDPRGIEYTAEAKLVVAQIPSDLQRYLNFDTAAAMQNLLRDPRLVGAVYAQIEEDPDPTRSRERYLAIVRDTVIREQLRMGWDGGSRTLTVSYTNSHRDAALRFVELLVEAVSEAMLPQVRQQAQRAEILIGNAFTTTRMTLSSMVAQAVERQETAREFSLERVAAFLDSNAESAIVAFADVAVLLERLETFTTDSANLFTAFEAPVVYETAKGRRATSLVISAVTAFFFFVFAAFVLQYARNVAADKEEVEKLRAAWEGR